MKNNNIKISIVMATYNGSNFIEEQLLSIYEQSLAADEVLIFDDCSQDRNCTRIIQNFISVHKLNDKWKLFNNRVNLGWKRNFVSGIQQAKGEYIFLSDQDDIWQPEKIRTMVDIMNRYNNINLLCSNYEILNETGKVIRFNSTQTIVNNNDIEFKKITPKFHLVGRPGCTYCLRQKFALNAVNAWSDGYAHDKLFWNAAILTNSLYCINTPLITFRRHSNNSSGRGTIKSCADRLRNHETDMAVFKNICDVFSEEIENTNTERKNCEVFIRYKSWLTLRNEYLNDKRILKGGRLLIFLPFYSSAKSLLADYFCGK